jgi:epsilon-lactone hydrolase
VTDLTVSGDSFTSKADADPNITAAAIAIRAAGYLAGADPTAPLASPLFADLSGLPP